MAATAWELYNLSKKKLGNGTIQLGVQTFLMHLFKGSSNCSTLTLSIVSSCNNEVTGGGYTSKTLASATWSAGANAATYRFTSNNVVFSASGANLTSIQFAVVRVSGTSANANNLLMKSKLSTAAFQVNDGNTLTVQINASGYFELY